MSSAHAARLLTPVADLDADVNARRRVERRPLRQTKNHFKKRNGKTRELGLHRAASKAVYRLATDGPAQPLDNAALPSRLRINDATPLQSAIDTDQDSEAVIPRHGELLDVTTCGKMDLAIRF